MNVSPKLISRCLLLYSFLGLMSFQQHKEPSYVHYTVDQGLPSSEIYCCFQDWNHFIWILTDNGISRFDGNKFENFTIEQGLCENTIFYYRLDQKNQRIWFRGFRSSITYYDYRTRQMVCPDENEWFVKALLGLRIADFWIDGDSATFKLRGDHYWQFNTKRNTFKDSTLVKPGIHFKKIGVNAMIYTCGILEKFRRFNYWNDTTVKTIWLKKPFFVEEKNVGSLKIGTRYYIFMKGKGLIFDEEKEVLIERDIPEEIITIPYLDRFGQIWCGSHNKGVFCFDQNLRETNRFLEGKTCTTILQDHEGGYWFSTLHNGLYYAKTLDIGHLPVIDKKIDALLSYKNSVFTTTYSGELYCTQFSEDSVWTELIRKKKVKMTNLTLFNDRLLYKNGFSKIEVFDLNTEEFFHMEGTYKTCYFQEIKGELWLFFSEYNKDLIRVCDSDLNEMMVLNSLKHRKIRKMLCVEETGDVYVGANSLLSIFSQQSGEENTTIVEKEIGPDIRCLTHYSGDSVLVGTQEKGVFLVRGNHVLKNWSKATGLSSNASLSIRVDDEKGIWIGTTAGVNYLSKPFDEGNGLYIMGREQGLSSDMIYDIAFVKNYVCVGTELGVDYFEKEAMLRSEPLLSAKIKQVKINNEVRQNTQDLSFYENSVSISFSAISFQNALHIPYRYRLLPGNGKWIETKSTTIGFPSLTPGVYTFEVQVANSSGRWGAISSHRFSIALPFWKRGWFIFLTILIGVVVIYTSIKWRIKTIRKELQLRYDANLSKNKMLAAQLNPHFIFNSLNSVAYYTANNNSKNAVMFLAGYTKLIRNVFENSDRLLVPLTEEIAFLEAYLKIEQNRFDNSFDYRLSVDIELTEKYLFPPLLSQPFLENAVIHGIPENKKGKIDVVFEKFDDKQLCCRIVDNGPGIIMDEIEKREHSGIKVTKSRMKLLEELLKQKVECQFTVENGTTVCLFFPLITTQNLKEYDQNINR